MKFADLNVELDFNAIHITIYNALDTLIIFLFNSFAVSDFVVDF